MSFIWTCQKKSWKTVNFKMGLWKIVKKKTEKNVPHSKTTVLLLQKNKKERFLSIGEKNISNNKTFYKILKFFSSRENSFQKINHIRNSEIISEDNDAA